MQIYDHDLSPEEADRLIQFPTLALDTETMGLIPRRDRLCLIQIGDPEGGITLVRQPLDPAPQLARVLTDPGSLKIFHFARFDLGMLAYHLQISVWPVFCTKVGSKLARTYSPRHGLKDVVAELMKVDLDKTAQSSDWGAVATLSTDQLRYASNDVRYLIPVYEKLTMILEREGRLNLAKACFQHLPTLVQLDLLGYEGVFEH